jgi:hypothetical protein
MDKNTLLASIKAEHACNRYLASAVGGPMPVERFSVALEFHDIINNWNTFHSSPYIRRVWGEFATVEQIASLHHGEQTAVILKNDRNL